MEVRVSKSAKRREKEGYLSGCLSGCLPDMQSHSIDFKRLVQSIICIGSWRASRQGNEKQPRHSTDTLQEPLTIPFLCVTNDIARPQRTVVYTVDDLRSDHVDTHTHSRTRTNAQCETLGALDGRTWNVSRTPIVAPVHAFSHCMCVCVCRPSAHKYKSAVVHDSLSKTMHCKTIPCYATITHSLPLSLSLSHSLFHSHYDALSLSLYVVVCVKFIVGPASSENFTFPWMSPSANAATTTAVSTNCRLPWQSARHCSMSLKFVALQRGNEQRTCLDVPETSFKRIMLNLFEIATFETYIVEQISSGVQKTM